MYSAETVAINAINGEDINIVRILYNLITGKASRQLYYVLVLIQLTVITPWLLSKIKKGNLKSKLLWLVTPAYVTLLYIYNFVYHKEPMFYATIFPAWFVFYYLGLHVRIKKDLLKKAKMHEKILCILIPICIGGSLLEAFVLYYMTHSSGFAVSQIKCSCFFLDLVQIILLILVEKKNHVKADILKRLGDYSYGIFYAHCLIMTLIEAGLKELSIDKPYSLYFAFTFIITATISGLFVYTIRTMLLKQKNGGKILELIGF